MTPTVAALTLAVLADTTAATRPPPPERPHVQAIRLEGPLSVDGVLSEPVWQAGEPFTAMTQRDPVEGAPASQRTEVRVAYDDYAVYVGARMYDSAPESIAVRLARRDASTASDRFAVYLDPLYDRRSGYFFMVNAAGTLYDGTLANDVEEDKSWDGVWEGRARTDAEGWTAEVRIPYSQLRFPRHQVDHWGINFMREIPRRREKDYAAYRPRKASGFVSRFPDLVGIEGLASPPSLELWPYVTTQSEHLEHPVGDPFNDGSRWRGTAGGDLRSRIGGLTLNGTINPDFGQVEVDPATVNLTDVEDFFEEKRPFFVEGIGNFSFGRQGAGDYWDYDWDDPLFFYSRRIGRAPQGRVPSSDFEDVPLAARILGAAKLTGRISPRWSLGTLHAVTDREEATLANETGEPWTSEIEPLTYYGVARAQRASRGRRNGFGLMGTATVRSLDEARLRPQLNSAAYLGGIDGWLFVDRAQNWVLSGWTSATRVEGSQARMISLARSSTHYFQRPDADHVEVDSSATSLSGWASRLWLNRQKGAVQFNSGIGFVSPGYEANDLGFQRRSDMVNGHVGSGYKWTRSNRLWRYQTLKGGLFTTYDLGGNQIRQGAQASGYTEFHNGHTLSYYATFDAEAMNNRRTRGGPLTLNPHAWTYGLDYLGDTQRRTYAFASLGARHSVSGSRSIYAYPGVEWKPSSAFSFKVTPGWEWLREDAQWIETLVAPGSPTYNRRYVFSVLDQQTASLSFRLNWTFTPRLSLQTYLRPFVSIADFHDFKALAAPGTYQFVPTPHLREEDFTDRSFKGNAVLRWEYRPGSTLFLVWTQERSTRDALADESMNLRSATDLPPENVFLAKISYYFTR